jgi:uncharacterized protein YndB with AHSA1/START domain
MKSNFTGKTSIIINAPAARVWGALTNPELIKEYFFGTHASSDWKVGSPITFEGEWEGEKYHDKGTILENIPNQRLKYNYWSSRSSGEDIPENYVDITYELKESDNKTELTVIQEKIEDEKMVEHSEANWKKVLEGLKALLEKN